MINADAEELIFILLPLTDILKAYRLHITSLLCTQFLHFFTSCTYCTVAVLFCQPCYVKCWCWRTHLTSHHTFSSFCRFESLRTPCYFISVYTVLTFLYIAMLFCQPCHVKCWCWRTHLYFASSSFWHFADFTLLLFCLRSSYISLHIAMSFHQPCYVKCSPEELMLLYSLFRHTCNSP